MAAGNKLIDQGNQVYAQAVQADQAAFKHRNVSEACGTFYADGSADLQPSTIPHLTK